MMKTKAESGKAGERESGRVARHDVKPPLGGLGGSIHDWERSLDPWHADAFPVEFRGSAPVKGERRKGWMALDAWGNPLMFLADGELVPE